MLNATHPVVSDANPRNAIEGEVRADLNLLVRRVFAQLPTNAPYVLPKHVAPILGITENALHRHCQNCRALRLWRGSYRFYTDDAGHMAALESLVKLVLWSGKKLPDNLRMTPMRAGATRVH